jgi:hypothetical protein
MLRNYLPPSAPRALLVAAIALVTWCAGPDRTSIAFAQLPGQPVVAAAPAAVPEPIYWKQQLFLIPYQWGSAAEPGAARAVWLFVSKDRGASWQKISEAKPDVKAFNYRAEGDGEFWFCVRTFDKLGHSWPQGPYQPELRVIVDTALPRIEIVAGRVVENGVIDIQARANDANLDGNTWRFEWQADPMGQWQPVILQNAGSNSQSCLIPAPSSTFHSTWQPPAGARPVAIRGIIFDRAGNSATYQARLESGSVVGVPAMPIPAALTTLPGLPNAQGPAVSGPLLSAPVLGAVPAAPLPTTAPTLQNPPTIAAPAANTASQGWASAVTVPPPCANAPPSAPTAAAVPASQPWPASNVAHAPFRLWTGGTSEQDDGVTSYGSPPLFAAPRVTITRAEPPKEEPRVGAKFASAAKPAADAADFVAPPHVPQFTALEPYREPTTPAVQTNNDWSSAIARPTVRDVTPLGSSALQHSPTSAPKLVGSRTFALEYDLDDVGRGVTKVELWGTRDGGQTWNRYVVDDDNRSPLIVTVDEEGVYGFRILVQNAGAAAAEPPRAGEAPELWVSVDLKRPVVELTGIERGEGNLSDHLKLRWRAIDNNLDSRPIALFYSSRPAGPWSAIATNLENTGEYAWRVERYVPSRFYLRIEARDVAGNLAAYQTRDAVEFSTSNIAGRLRSAQPVGPAVGTSDSYR